MTQGTRNKLIWGAIVLAGAACLYLIVVLGFWVSAQKTAYPGTTIAGVNVSGQTEEQIEKTIKPTVDRYLAAEVNFDSKKPVSATAGELGLAPDYEKTARAAVAWGAGNPFVLGRSKNFPVVFTADSEKLDSKIVEISEETNTSAEDPTLYLENGEIKFKNGSTGERINLAQTAANFWGATNTLESNVKVATFQVEPSFTESQVQDQLAEIKKETMGTVSLSDGSNSYPVDQATLVSWVELSGGGPTLAEKFGDDSLLVNLAAGKNSVSIFSPQAVSNYLTNLSDQINRAPKNAELSVSGGAVVVALPSQTGKLLDVPGSVATVLDGLSNGKPLVSLAVTSQKPEVREDNLSQLGLSELVSTGYTNFSGSPANRIHNVTVGASKFNGILIRPNEVFSFNDTLGPVDASTGFLPELVILENKTVPQYGGGMCQVSSTAFRAALNAGMPILERTAHAYPVSYYKPYGVDATIYLPKPDLIFQNDTGHYILVQTQITGYKLTFNFYGTKPNRVVSFAGDTNGAGAVSNVEQITPAIYAQGARGDGSFTAQFWRFITDSTGKQISKSTWISKYDSPSKYPH